MFSCPTYIIKIIRAANGQQKAAKILVPKPHLGAERQSGVFFSADMMNTRFS
jgi:hypothetical protein